LTLRASPTSQPSPTIAQNIAIAPLTGGANVQYLTPTHATRYANAKQPEYRSTPWDLCDNRPAQPSEICLPHAVHEQRSGQRFRYADATLAMRMASSCRVGKVSKLVGKCVARPGCFGSNQSRGSSHLPHHHGEDLAAHPPCSGLHESASSAFLERTRRTEGNANAKIYVLPILAAFSARRRFE
jgi:hypothetical protein